MDIMERSGIMSNKDIYGWYELVGRGLIKRIIGQ